MTGQPPAEVVVTPDLVRARVAPLLGAPPREVRSIGEGWDNAAFLVDDTWLFRFPRRAAAVPLLEHEVRLLPRLAPFLPAPIPEPVHVGGPGPGFPWPFAGHRMLPGREAAQARLDGEARAALAAPVARFLRALHRVPVDALVVDLPQDPTQRADMQRRVPLALMVLGDVASLGLVDDLEPWREVVEPALALPAAAREAVVHGDLHARHLLVDAAGAFAGVIDWGDVHHGDPAVDLQLVWSFFPPTTRAEFLGHYGPVPSERLLRARVVAVFLSATLAGHAARTRQDALLHESLEGLRRCLDPGGV